MQLEIGNWTLEKAGDGHTDKTVRVRMIANTLGIDRENQQIVAKAFDEPTVDHFLKNGHIDWFHKSVSGETIQERALAVLGRPVSFRWENGLPVVYADLTKANPIVRDAILPHLEAGNAVLGSSVGGSVLGKAVKMWDRTRNLVKEVISNIYWDHLAIAPRSGVISRGTEISLVKARGEDAVNVHFYDLQDFVEHYEGVVGRESEIFKALTVGSGTDSATLTGVDALRKQSLEQKPMDTLFSKSLVERLTKALSDGEVQPNRKSVESFFKGLNYSQIDSERMTRHLLKTLSSAVAA